MHKKRTLAFPSEWKKKIADPNAVLKTKAMVKRAMCWIPSAKAFPNMEQMLRGKMKSMPPVFALEKRQSFGILETLWLRLTQHWPTDL